MQLIKRASGDPALAGIGALRIPGTVGQTLVHDGTEFVAADGGGGTISRYKEPVRVATTAQLPTSNATTTTITATANGAFPAIDGVTLDLDDSILVKDEVATARNGIYTLTQTGDALAPWILTRRNDADSDSKVKPAMFVFVEEGTDNGDFGFVLKTNATIVLGTTGLTFGSFTTDDSNVVHRTGDPETITSIKTFDADVIIADTRQIVGETSLDLQGSTGSIRFFPQGVFAGAFWGISAGPSNHGLILGTTIYAAPAGNRLHFSAESNIAYDGGASGAAVKLASWSGDVPTFGDFNAGAEQYYQSGDTQRFYVGDNAGVPIQRMNIDTGGVNALVPVTASREDGTNSTVLDLLTLTRSTSHVSHGATGIGVGILLRSEDNGGNLEDAARINAVLTNATGGSEAGALDVWTRTGGAALSQKFRFDGIGMLAVGTTLAGSGAGIGLANNIGIAGSNSGGSAYVELCRVSGSNTAQFGSTGATSVVIGSNIHIRIASASTTHVTLTTTEATFGINGASPTALKIKSGAGSGNNIPGPVLPIEATGGTGTGTESAVTISASDAVASGTGVHDVREVARFANALITFRTENTDRVQIDAAGNLLSLANWIELDEISEPANAGANKARLFVKDTGGKTQLMVRFASGASQPIAIEP